MEKGLPQRLTSDNFALEGLIRFLKKTFGVKKEPIKADNEKLVDELLGRLTASSNEIENDFHPEPYRFNGEKYSMAIRGPISHVADMFVQMDQWLNSSGNINEGKRYCAELKRGGKELDALWREKRNSMGESDLDDLLIERGIAIGKAIKEPRFNPLAGKSTYDWDETSLNKPESSAPPTVQEVFAALRKVRSNHTAWSVLRAKWKGGDFAGLDWDDAPFLTEAVADSEAGDYFYHQGKPEKACGAPASIQNAYRDTLESLLDYCVRCFDLKDK